MNSARPWASGAFGRRVAQAVEAFGGAGPAQHDPLQPPHQGAERRAVEPGGGERMFQQREQRHGGEVLQDRFAEQPEKAPGARLAQRRTGRIVDRDVPAAELRRDAAGELAVRGDQRGGPARRLQHLAHPQRDHARLLARAGQVERREAGQRLVGHVRSPRH